LHKLQTPNQLFTYYYDNNGNIAEIDCAAYKQIYVYDKANQLTRENYSDKVTSANSYTRLYTYDTAGNILTSTSYAYTVGTVGSKHGDEVTYSYSSGQWKDQLTGTVTRKYNNGTLTSTVTSPTVTYNADGNMTRHSFGYLDWTGNQLTYIEASAVEMSFKYDKNGLRTQKMEQLNGEGWRYYYNGGQLERMEAINWQGTPTGITMTFAYDAAGKPWIMDYFVNGTPTAWYFFEYNAQGDVIGLLNSSNQRVVEYRYDAWGKPLSVTGSLANTIGQYNPFRYRAYVWDNETGWYYLKSRYYDPSIRRFISRDALMSTGQGLLGLNMYAY